MTLSSCTILVNRNTPLPADYIPADLMICQFPFDASADDPKRLLRQKAALAAGRLFESAKKEGLFLYGISGYRPHARQSEIYNSSLLAKGEEHTIKYIAFPGCSEHQTGLALDVSCPSINLELIDAFADTREGQWLRKNAPLHGFILRYPKGKEDITGFACEPWHIRYIGKTLALYLSMTNQTLEEYYNAG